MDNKNGKTYINFEEDAASSLDKDRLKRQAEETYKAIQRELQFPLNCFLNSFTKTCISCGSSAFITI